MSDLEKEWQEFKKDTRMACQYGAKCYQKNPVHLNKYKHPPKKKQPKNNGTNVSVTVKKRKLDADKVEEKKETLSTSSDNEIEVKPDTVEPRSDKRETISDSDSNGEEDKNKSNYDDVIPDSFSESDEVTPEEQKKINLKTSLDSKEDTNKRDRKETISDTDSDATNKLNNEKISMPEEQGLKEKKPFNIKTFIKNRFLVDMPQDFYDLWEFCKTLKPKNPSEAFKEIGLILVGPYDVLSGKFKHVKKSPEDFLRHWRYYYDPPEFQTVIKGDDKTGYHMGYFRDSPEEEPVFVLANHGIKDGVFNRMGDNIFGALNTYLEDMQKSGDPFKKMNVSKFLPALKKKANELNYTLSSNSEKTRKRNYKVVANTANKIGLVVPYNKKTQLGYRDLALSDKEIKTILDKLDRAASEQRTKLLSDLQPVITYTSIALDECDFGSGLKFGLDLLAHGNDTLNSVISRFLCDSYRLLNREAFAKIAEAHLAKRKKSCDLSII